MAFSLRHRLLSPCRKRRFLDILRRTVFATISAKATIPTSTTSWDTPKLVETEPPLPTTHSLLVVLYGQLLNNRPSKLQMKSKIGYRPMNTAQLTTTLILSPNLVITKTHTLMTRTPSTYRLNTREMVANVRLSATKWWLWWPRTRLKSTAWSVTTRTLTLRSLRAIRH